MDRRVLCVLAMLMANVAAQSTCSLDASVWLVLDVSEVARTGSSSNPNGLVSERYDILADQLTQYADTLGNDVNIGIISYTSGLSGRENSRVTLEPRPASVVADLIRTQAIGTPGLLVPDGELTSNGLRTGGSQTLEGLLEAQKQSPDAGKAVNMVVLVSTSNSFDPREIAPVRDAGVQVRQKFGMFVAGVERTGVALFEEELKAAAGLASNQNDNLKYVRVFGYFNLASALTQWVTPQLQSCASTNPCATCQFYSGKRVVGHPATCTRFYQCLEPQPGSSNPYPFIVHDCERHTLFDIESGTCVWPKDYNCGAWNGTCKANGLVEKFAHLCCGKWWQCGADGDVTTQSCPTNLPYFNGQECVSGSNYTGDATCRFNSICEYGPRSLCDGYRAAPGEPCYFYQTIPNQNREVKKRCSAGLAWDSNLCTCAIRNSACNNDLGVNQKNGLDSLGRCRSYLSLSFNGNFNTWDDVRNAPAIPVIGAGTVRIRNNAYAQFSGLSGVSNDLLFIYAFANREFPHLFAFKIVFRFDDIPRTESPHFVLVSNDRCGKCDPTLQLRAERKELFTGEFEWDITLDVTSTSNTRTTITLSGVSLSTLEWNTVEVRVKPEIISVTAITPPTVPGGSQVVTTRSGSIPTNTRVNHNDCGLSIGQGTLPGKSLSVAMRGDVDEFKFYECSNLDILF